MEPTPGSMASESWVYRKASVIQLQDHSRTLSKSCIPISHITLMCLFVLFPKMVTQTKNYKNALMQCVLVLWGSSSSAGFSN